VFEDSENIILVMELMKEDSLQDYVSEKKQAKKPQIKRAITDLLGFLKYFHSLGYIHRDIKPSNIMVEDTQTLSIKVCDFGVSCAKKF
jgi:serine/threonine protein kinase